MKPERSEMITREEQEPKGLVFTNEVREILGDLLECAFIKVLSFVTRLWAPEVASQPEGADESDADD